MELWLTAAVFVYVALGVLNALHQRNEHNEDYEWSDWILDVFFWPVFWLSMLMDDHE